ncbi:MAG: hypothetical protein BroJett030_19000 [Alphaproteobacteria bacterium]|nr:MAG: hypothetical protein BroJett030_19000 [Alphaproteobacteria bacterium]
MKRIARSCAYLAILAGLTAVTLHASQALTAGRWAKLPAEGVVAGRNGGLGPLAVCRAGFDAGQHPGKLWQGQCHFEWGWDDHITPSFEVLLDDGYRWENPGRVVQTVLGPVWKVELPSNAVDGGDAGTQAAHTRLGICLAFMPADNTWHPGKFFAEHCNIAWGGVGVDSMPDHPRNKRKVAPLATGNVLVLVK